MIDLGEVPAAGVGEPDPARPRRSLPYRRLLGPPALALAVALGGAVPPPPPPPEPLTLPVTVRDSVRVEDGRIHVIGPGEELAGQPRSRRMMRYPVGSYTLPGLTPGPRWTLVLDGDVGFIGSGPGDLLLYSYQGDFEGGTAVAAVRPGSSEPVWNREVFLYGLAPDRATALAFEALTESFQDFVGLDTRTGATRWRVSRPAGGQMIVRDAQDRADFPERIYTLRPDGLIETWDTGTGRSAGTTRTTVPVDGRTQFWSAGGLLLVGHPDIGTVGYDGRDLTERWRAVPGLEENTYPYACGIVICLTGRPGGLAAIDPATGRDLWRNDFWAFTQPIGDRLLVGVDDLIDPELAVLDPMTGRIVADVGPWRSGGSGPEPGTAWVYRIRSPDYQMRYGVLELATGKVRVLGIAERIAGDCRFVTGVLVCRRLDSSVGVWRL